MDTPTDRPEQVHAAAMLRLKEARVAGNDTRHNRAANLEAARSVVENDVHYTWGIKNVETFTFEEVLDAIASITQCSRDPRETSGGGYISPSSTLAGLEEAAQRIVAVARRGGTFAMGTGHPGSMLLFYIELACLIRDLGGVVVEPAKGARIPPNLNLDYVEGVAVTTDRASLMHSHDFRAMEIILESARIDMVIADHGYAGAAINVGIPVIAVMDTNDPALAVAKQLGADVSIIPMDDNRPLSDYQAVVQTLSELIQLVDENPDGSPQMPVPESPPSSALNDRLQMNGRLRSIERFVSEQAGPNESLDDLMMSILDTHRDQFRQTFVESEQRDERADDPLLTLVIYKRLHDALLRAAMRKMARVDTGLPAEQILGYLQRPSNG